MKIEKLKSIFLVTLIALSAFLSFMLWTGVRQYEVLPMWLTNTPNIPGVEEEQPDDEDIEEVKVLATVISPERLVEHDLPRHNLYWVSSSEYSLSVWQLISSYLKHDVEAELLPIDVSEWKKATKQNSFEFIFAGNYPIEILFPQWYVSGGYQNIKLERLLVLDSGQPEILLCSLSDNYYFRVNLNDVPWPTEGVSSLLDHKGENGWSVYDAGYESSNILTGVYVPLNFINKYGNQFPEVWIAAETPARQKWLSIFFNNTSLVREISLSNNKYHYSLGPTSLSLDYSFAPHFDYSYTQLETPEISEITYFDAAANSSTFIVEHSPVNWNLINNALRLTRSDFNYNNNRYEFAYSSYITNTTVSVPVESVFPAWEVYSENGVITKMKGQIWRFGRLNYVPKVTIDATDAIIRLSSDDWKVASELNPYAPEVIENFQNYLVKGYKVSDLYIAYYVNKDFEKDDIFISPHWAISLTNGSGSVVRFYINAMTGYIPSDNGIIIN